MGLTVDKPENHTTTFHLARPEIIRDDPLVNHKAQRRAIENEVSVINLAWLSGASRDPLSPMRNRGGGRPTKSPLPRGNPQCYSIVIGTCMIEFLCQKEYANRARILRRNRRARHRATAFPGGRIISRLGTWAHIRLPKDSKDPQTHTRSPNDLGVRCKESEDPGM